MEIVNTLRLPVNNGETDDTYDLSAQIVEVIELESPETIIENKLNTLGQLFLQEANLQWEIGDLLIELEGLGVQTKDIQKRFDRDASTLSQYKTTAAAFPEEQRDYSIPFYRHLITKTAFKRVVGRAKRTHGLESTLTLPQALEIVKRNNYKKPNDITTALRNRLRQELTPANEQEALIASVKASHDAPDLLGKCHLSDCLELLPRIAPKSVQIVWCDPPYANYKHSILTDHAWSAKTNCDNEEIDIALAMTCQMFSLIEPALADNGVVLLWQSANVLRAPILSAIEAAGLEVEILVIWDKSRSQPGYPESPYTQQFECCWIIKRKKDILHNYDGSDRRNILKFSPVQHNRGELDLTHAYQKPEDLCEFIISKHSQKEMIVADLFGCSGSFCIAAEKLDRNWIYCESNPENFAFGAERIAEAVNKQIAKDA